MNATVEAPVDLEAAGFRSRAAWRDVVGQLKRSRATVEALEENHARLASRLAAVEDRAYRAEAELALLGAGLTPAQTVIARRLVHAEKPADLVGWFTKFKENFS